MAEKFGERKRWRGEDVVRGGSTGVSEECSSSVKSPSEAVVGNAFFSFLPCSGAVALHNCFHREATLYQYNVLTLRLAANYKEML